jgi:hypothetical protein
MITDHLRKLNAGLQMTVATFCRKFSDKKLAGPGRNEDPPGPSGPKKLKFETGRA